MEEDLLTIGDAGARHCYVLTYKSLQEEHSRGRHLSWLEAKESDAMSFLGMMGSEKLSYLLG